jgi:DNA polymerase III alpha subunit
MLYTARSYYSLRYGTMPVEKLVEEAGKRNIGALALTDINNSSACFDFAELCREEQHTAGLRHGVQVGRPLPLHLHRGR